LPNTVVVVHRLHQLVREEIQKVFGTFVLELYLHVQFD